MTAELSISGVTGTDGVVPVYDPEGTWRIWALHDIYLGQEASKKYVPKVKDYVVDVDINDWYWVIEVDPTTLIARLGKLQQAKNDTLSEYDRLLGVGPGTQSDTYRVYIDKSVNPHTLAVDARLTVNGTMTRTCKIFKGSELSGSDKVISAVYDQAGTLLGQAIPLELVSMPNHQNYSTKTVPTCYTTEDLKDGEMVTAVFYSDEGHVVSKRQLLVENTAFIRAQNYGVKYITGISLESPFLSKTDLNLIQYPLNVPLSGLNLIGVVSYSDGSQLRMPVDNTKFSIFGFDGYVATIIGQKFSLVLKYTLSADEVVYGSYVGDGRFITETYKATTIKPDGAFTIKLFCYPEWINSTQGYRIKWYMYNLDRSVSYDVTPHVRINANTYAFNPIAYGTLQNISVSVNLKDVNGAYADYIHVQSVGIILMAPGTDRTRNWLVGWNPGQEQSTFYGPGIHCTSTIINQNLSHVNIGAWANSKEEWLNRIFYNTQPLYDTARELKAPEPDYFVLDVNGFELEFPISQWNSTLVLNTTIQDSDTLMVKFIKRTPDNDLQLCASGLPTYQTT